MCIRDSLWDGEDNAEPAGVAVLGEIYLLGARSFVGREFGSLKAPSANPDNVAAVPS